MRGALAAATARVCEAALHEAREFRRMTESLIFCRPSRGAGPPVISGKEFFELRLFHVRLRDSVPDAQQVLAVVAPRVRDLTLSPPKPELGHICPRARTSECRVTSACRAGHDDPGPADGMAKDSRNPPRTNGCTHTAGCSGLASAGRYGAGAQGRSFLHDFSLNKRG